MYFAHVSKDDIYAGVAAFCWTKSHFCNQICSFHSVLISPPPALQTQQTSDFSVIFCSGTMNFSPISLF